MHFLGTIVICISSTRTFIPILVMLVIEKITPDEVSIVTVSTDEGGTVKETHEKNPNAQKEEKRKEPPSQGKKSFFW